MIVRPVRQTIAVGITIRELPGDLRASLDERDKGDKFERLIKAYLETGPERTEMFSEVRQDAWPGRGDRRWDRPGRREPWRERLRRRLADYARVG